MERDFDKALQIRLEDRMDSLNYYSWYFNHLKINDEVESIIKDSDTFEEARDRAEELIAKKCWPCYFFTSDTTGEKDFEEFFTDKEDLDMNRFETVGIIKNQPIFDEAKLDEFMVGIDFLREKRVVLEDEKTKLKKH